MTALLPPHPEDRFAETLLGDTVALDELLRAHRPAVEAVCFRRLRSRTDAEDAVQETMLRGIRSLHNVEDPSRLRSYLCRIAERVCLDMLRAGAKAMPAEEVEAIAPPAAEHLEPENQALERERARLVHQTLRALSDRQAQALWMRDAMGEPVPKVAASLGVTEGSARVLLTRARAKMRSGWAKVAAILPGTGMKLPVFAAKVLHVGPLAIPVVPAVAVAVAVIASPVALHAIHDAPETVVRALDGETIKIPGAVIEPVSVTTTLPSTAPGAQAVTSTRQPAAGSSASTQPNAPVHQAPAASIDLGGQQVGAGGRPADPEQDDVTLGDGDLLQVGAGIEEVADQLGASDPDVDIGHDPTGR